MGIMDGIAAAAGGVVNMMDKREDEQIQTRRDERLNELAMRREEAVAALKERMAMEAEDRKREQAANDAKAIDDGAGEINRGRMAGLINQREGSSMTAEDAKVLEGNEAAQKAYGITPRTRAQTYDDKIAAAEGKGLIGSVKELRGQQDVEIRRDSEERRLTADENRSKAAAAETARKEKADRGREDAANARIEAYQRKTDAVAAAAEIRNSKTATARERTDAALNLNTTVSTQGDLIKTKTEQLTMLDPDSPTYGAQAKALKGAIADAEEIQAMAQKALKGTLEEGNVRRDARNPAKPDAPKPKPVGITKAEYDKLPKGSSFIAPDGSRRIKP